MSREAWTRPEVLKALVGKKIARVRASTKQEYEEFEVPIIETEDGFVVGVLCDQEGNGPGALHMIGQYKPKGPRAAPR